MTFKVLQEPVIFAVCYKKAVLTNFYLIVGETAPLVDFSCIQK